MKKIDAPAFMIAQNPITSNKIFIVHNGTPFVMAEVNDFYSSDVASITGCQMTIKVGSKTVFGEETYLLDAVMILPDEKFDALDEQKKADKLASLMRRMADWYHAYLKWQEEQKLEE